MTIPVYVTGAQVAAARVLVERYAETGRECPEAVKLIAEAQVGELSCARCHHAIKWHAPGCLWDFLGERICECDGFSDGEDS